jgi:microcystin-dependent protein
MDVFLGTILPFGFNYAPVYWSTCQGQLLPISQYSALFALLGTTFGGNGQTIFGLPNLQGRLPIGVGQGPAGTLEPGEQGGAAAVTLVPGNLPNAPVTLQVSSNTTGNQNAPSAEYPYLSASGGGPGSAAIWSNTMTGPQSVQGISLQGGSQPVPVMNPFLALNFCIAMQGIVPSRQ